MIPFRDHNYSNTGTPFITIGLIALNLLIFLGQLAFQAMGQLDLVYYNFALIPARVSSFDPLAFLTFFTSMFMHGGWMHLIGNMLYLWIFGDNIEDRLGHFGYLVFYVGAGLFAGFAHLLTDLDSSIPTLGASGAISGVLGAYLVLYPQARVDTLVFLGYYGRVIQLPAVVVLGGWFVLQLFPGVLSLGSSGGGIAYWAHIGGFVAGVAVAGILRLISGELGRQRGY